MQALNPQQEEFCKLYVSGTKASQAYKQAYSKPNMKLSCLIALGSRVLRKSFIQSRVKELQDLNIKMSMKTREDHIKRLEEIAFDSDADARDMIKAIEVLNQMKGYNLPKLTMQKMQVEFVEGRALPIKSGNDTLIASGSNTAIEDKQGNM